MPGIQLGFGLPDRGGNNHQLPAPAVDLREQEGSRPRFAKPLRRIITPFEDHVPCEGGKHRIGMQGAQAAEAQEADAIGMDFGRTEDGALN